MCKPYITAQITIIDSINFVNGLGLQGGEPVTFSFDGGGHVYEQLQFVLSLSGEQSSTSLRTTNYTIETVGQAFLRDAASTVQDSTPDMPSTALAKKIHEEYIAGDAPLSAPVAGSGALSIGQTGGGFTTLNRKPIAAIEDILRQTPFAGIKTGSGMYFRDANQYVMAPLEYLFGAMGSQQEFWQSTALGYEWQHAFGGGSKFPTDNAIIAAATVVKDYNSARGGVKSRAATASLAKSVADVSRIAPMISSVASAVASALSGAGRGGLGGVGGGLQQVFQLDSRQRQPQNDQSMNSNEEAAFQASVKDAINYYIKVPIQSGINVTVGKGATIHLVPPVGDLNSGLQNIDGAGLVADLCHECYFDSRPMQATTTFRWVKGYQSNG